MSVPAEQPRALTDVRRQRFVEALARLVARRVVADLERSRSPNKANPASETTDGGALDRKRRREHEQPTP